MKKSFFLLTLSVLINCSYSSAQQQGEVVISGGIGRTLHSDLGSLGYGGGMEYWLYDALSMAGQFHRYPRENKSYSITNIDLRRYFIDVGVGFYGSLGYTYLNLAGNSGRHSTNIGTGLIIPISCSMAIGTELKYTPLNVNTESGSKKLGFILGTSLVLRI